jgi:hypothetical protein
MLPPPMIPRILRYASAPALFACIAAASCSSTAPTPEAMVNETMSAGTNIGCPFQDESFARIGAPTSPNPQTVSDGDTYSGATVHVGCSVTPSGGGFDIQASASITGTNGGSLTITGHVDSTGGSGLHGGFTQNGQSYDQDNGCTVTYTMGNPPSPVPPQGGGPAVAGGRIWGHIDCPMAVDTDRSAQLPDGGSGFATCEGSADFLFANCTGS